MSTPVRNLAIAINLALGLLVAHSGSAGAEEPLKLGRAVTDTFVGRKMMVDGPKGPISLKFDKKGQVQVAAPDGVNFKGFWWVPPSGYLCFVSEVWWRGGECWHLFINEKGTLVRIHPERRPDDVTYPVTLR